jgi:hypothetical protein
MWEPVGTKVDFSIFALSCTIQNSGHMIALLDTCFRTGSAYSMTLKKEAVYSSETSVDFQQTVQHFISEDSILYVNQVSCLKLIMRIISDIQMI